MNYLYISILAGIASTLFATVLPAIEIGDNQSVQSVILYFVILNNLTLFLLAKKVEKWQDAN